MNPYETAHAAVMLGRERRRWLPAVQNVEPLRFAGYHFEAEVLVVVEPWPWGHLFQARIAAVLGDRPGHYMPGGNRMRSVGVGAVQVKATRVWVPAVPLFADNLSVLTEDNPQATRASVLRASIDWAEAREITPRRAEGLH